MKEFKGRVIAEGTVSAEAVVSHEGLNTLASFQKGPYCSDLSRLRSYRQTAKPFGMMQGY